METLEIAYWYLLLGMSILAIGVFIALQFVTAPYGMTHNNRWGVSINSKWGWFWMEIPVFLTMGVLYYLSLHYGIKPFNWVTFAIFIFFEVHYFQRSILFPAMMRGQSKMPISLIITGFTFNVMNAVMQGGWLFYFSPDGYYPIEWFWSPQFIIGSIIFLGGMIINLQSDKIIRSLRTERTDNNYYLPDRWLFKHINSANYFGELLEWIGFAILSWSISGFVFVLWSFANIVPRAKAVYERYSQFFGEEFTSKKRWKIFPYIY